MTIRSRNKEKYQGDRAEFRIGGIDVTPAPSADPHFGVPTGPEPGAEPGPVFHGPMPVPRLVLLRALWYGEIRFAVVLYDDRTIEAYIGARSVPSDAALAFLRRLTVRARVALGAALYRLEALWIRR